MEVWVNAYNYSTVWSLYFISKLHPVIRYFYKTSYHDCLLIRLLYFPGKGNYWAIHPACVEDFSKGDFRRRQARRRARKCQKEGNFTDMRNTFGYNVGYVPMTASHIPYHPYASPTSQLYYPQSTALSSASQQASLSPSYTSSVPSSPVNPQSNPGYSLQPCSNSSSVSSNPAMSTAAQRFLTEQANSTMFTMQALAQQQLAASLQFQSWWQCAF